MSSARLAFSLWIAALLASASCAGSGGGPSPGDSEEGDDAAAPDTGSAADAPAGPTTDAATSGKLDGGDATSPGRDSGAQAEGGVPSEGGAPPVDAGAEASAGEGGRGGACSGGPPAVQDGFEGSLSAWQVTDPFGNPIPAGSAQYSVTLDGTHVHSGTQAVKVHGGGLIGMAPPGPAFYGRAWMFFGSTPGTIPSGGHWGGIIGVGPSGGAGQAATEVRMGGQFGILIYNYSTNDDVVLSDPNFFNDGMDAGTSPIVGAWACVEFYFGKDSLRTWINETEVTSLDVTPATVWAHGMKAPWSPDYAAIRLGYANYNANTVDVWYDDVALDTSRICCE